MPQMLFMDMNLYLTHSYYANVLFNSEFRERNSERKFWDTFVQKIHLNLAVANGKKKKITFTLFTALLKMSNCGD